MKSRKIVTLAGQSYLAKLKNEGRRESPSLTANCGSPGALAAQQLAGIRAGVFSVLESHVPIDHDPTIPARTLHQARIVVGRQVVHHFGLLDAEFLEVVDQNVG